MMRSLFSGVSGLKTHQTKMDVIGNNISNVNTVAFKSTSVTFNEVMYQTTASAAGANAQTGTGGINAKQIGLGVNMGATTVNIKGIGATQTTGNPFDVKLTSDSFFVVSNGSQNYYTKAGNFYIDGDGNLAMTTTGYIVQGWQPDDATGNIVVDQVSPLKVMQEKFKTSAPEATTMAECNGILDKNDTNVNGENGRVMTLSFFDSLGYTYTAKFAVRAETSPTFKKGEYSVELTDVLSEDGTSVIPQFKADGTPFELKDLFGKEQYVNRTYTLQTEVTVSDLLGADGTTKVGVKYTKNGVEVGGYVFPDAATANLPATPAGLVPGEAYWNSVVTGLQPVTTGAAVYDERDVFNIGDAKYNAGTTIVKDFGATGATCTIKGTGDDGGIEIIAHKLAFNTDNGTFNYVGTESANSVMLNASVLNALGNFQNIEVNFAGTSNVNNKGTSTIGCDPGLTANDGTGAVLGKGKRLGRMTGIAIQPNGMIVGSYSNGNTRILGQIAVASFANSSGLEKVGDNLYDTTLNSGEFDGVGQDVTADGGKMSSGVLEMSNVDLSTEFTEMITTQRGFQANSRIITTSDTLLEELINLKR